MNTGMKVAPELLPKINRIIITKSVPEQAMLSPRGVEAIRFAALVLRFFLKRNKFSRLKGMASSTASPGKINIRPPSLMST